VNNEPKVMLLIDADNVSIDVIEQAVAWVHKHHGGPHVRRAYCTPESAVKHQHVFKRLSIRPMVNLAAGKNSTDIALAIDAIDLTLTERPDVVVIASSDSDFAPLVSRLREKGCRVVGIGQDGKTGDETIAVYDDYEVMAHRKGAAPARRSARTALPAAAPAGPAPAAARAPRQAPAAPKPAVKAAAKKTTARKTAAAPARMQPPAEIARAPLPDKALALLQALPALARGETVELRVAAEGLRKLGLLSKSGSSTKLFGQFPALFELQPAQQPNHVKALPAALR
jgi:uncharacterized LabA/DUF88 family protein